MALVLVTLLLAACSSDQEDEGITPVPTEASRSTTTATATTEPASTTTEPKTVEDEVRDAYLAAEAAFADAVEDPQQDDAAIAEHWSGDALKFVRGVLKDLRDTGVYGVEPVAHPTRSEVVGVSIVGPNEAKVIGCVVSYTVMTRRSSGEVVDDSVSSALSESTVTRSGKSWTVSSGTIQQKWMDDKGCKR